MGKGKGWDILQISLDTNLRDADGTYQIETFSGNHVNCKKMGAIISIGANTTVTIMSNCFKRPCFIKVPIFV